MARNKSNRQRDENFSPRPRKTTVNDLRKNGRDRGYQNLADIIFNGGNNLPKR